VPPFASTYRPEQPLAAFRNKIGGAANGTWTLRVQDTAALDTGAIQCISLNLFTQALRPVTADFEGDGAGRHGGLQEQRRLGDPRSSTGFTLPLTKNWGGAGYTAAPADYDGDGVVDLGLYRESTGDWLVMTSSTDFTGAFSVNWGGAGYKPVAGDYDGDGRADLTIYNTTTGVWSVLKSSSFYSSSVNIGWGGTGYAPIPDQDFDGDGTSTSRSIAWRRARGWCSSPRPVSRRRSRSDGAAPTTRSCPATTMPRQGRPRTLQSSDRYLVDPAVGVRIHELACHQLGRSRLHAVSRRLRRRSQDRRGDLSSRHGQLGVLKSAGNYTTAFSVAAWGAPGDMPITNAIAPGGSDTTRATDFDGDAKADIAVYNNATGGWSILKSSGGYTTALSVSVGGGSYVPVPGDFDGDGKADAAVYHVTSGTGSCSCRAPPSRRASRRMSAARLVTVAADYDGDGKTDFARLQRLVGDVVRVEVEHRLHHDLNVSWGGTGYPPARRLRRRTAAPTSRCIRTRAATGSSCCRANYTTTIRRASARGLPSVAGDFDGDGRADFIVYNATSGLWYGLKSSTAYTTTLSVGWGGHGYVPVRGDYDGDGNPRKKTK
jgi:hypothetical protein